VCSPTDEATAQDANSQRFHPQSPKEFDFLLDNICAPGANRCFAGLAAGGADEPASNTRPRLRRVNIGVPR
jgi:hypothetical protein